MAAERGKNFTLAIGDGATSEAFTTIGGMRVTAARIGNTAIDITDKDSDSWTELLANAGGRQVTITGDGIFKDSVAEQTFIDAALGGLIDNYELTEEGGYVWSGAFQIESYEKRGEHQGAVLYSFTLQSSGTVTRAVP